MSRLDPLKDRPDLVLRQIGQDLRVSDLHLVGVLAKRLGLARQVGLQKRRQATPKKPLGANIYRADIERRRLREVRQEAVRLGIDPVLAVGILSEVINESCKRQMIQRERGQFGYGNVEYGQLKRNLIKLTSLVAGKYDENYATAYPATQAHLDFEVQVLDEQIAATPNQRRALDLGCATGRTSFQLAGNFDLVNAIDISPAMVAECNRKAEADGVANVIAEAGDIEQAATWENIPDGSIDFVTMGMGTASDIRSIRMVLGQVERVLASQGRFLLSFYNADALLYKVGYFPWPESLAAVVDLERHCLDVQFRGKTYSVFARAYTLDELEELFSRRLQVVQQYAHPTFAAILPREMLLAAEASTLITELDKDRAQSGAGDGAYIITTGRKG